VKVEALIQPEAHKLVAAAKGPAEKQRLYRALGDMYLGLKCYSAAEEWYRKLVKEAPSQFPAVVGALTRQKKFTEAVDLCAEAAKSDETVQPALVLATILSNPQATREVRQRAAPHLTAALKKFGNDARLLYSAAMVCVLEAEESKDKANESIELFRKVVQINPRFVPALNNLAMMLAERPADRAEALKLIDKALAIAGKDPNLLDTKGSILLYGGNSQDALPLFKSAASDANADPRHYFHWAVALHDQGSTEAKDKLQIAFDRNLGAQVLTPTDKRLLDNLQAALQLRLPTAVSPTSTSSP
jgi:tetratricopeptide (TPR) repeat protein